MSDTFLLYRLFIDYPHFFYAFISKHYPLSEKHLTLLEKDISWGLIALNEEIEFNIPMIKKYSEKLNKDDLGCNRKVNENKEILNYFKLKSGSYWQEANEEVLESEVDKSEYHPSIRYHEYSFEEIEKNKHNIQWNHFSGNEFINWNFDLIFRYKDYLWFGIQEDPETYTTDGLELHNNESVPWDLKLIQLFADKVLTHKEVVTHFMFNNTMVKNIKPLINEELFTKIVYNIGS